MVYSDFEYKEQDEPTDEMGLNFVDFDIETCRREAQLLTEIGEELEKDYIRQKIRHIALCIDLDTFDYETLVQIIDNNLQNMGVAEQRCVVVLLFFKDLVLRSWLAGNVKKCMWIFKYCIQYIAEKEEMVGLHFSFNSKNNLISVLSIYIKMHMMPFNTIN